MPEHITLAPYRPTGPLNPVAAQVAGVFSANPLSVCPVSVTRDAMRAACVMTGEPAMVSVNDYLVPSSDGAEIGVRVYRPLADPAAVIIWAHGGGFALGSIDEIDNFSRLLAKCSDCVVVSVEYRLAPEYRFPTAVHDVEAAVSWLAENGELADCASLPLWLGGDSAGGNLATVVTRRMHAAGMRRISGNILVYPCTDAPDAPSLRDFDPPFMSADDVAWFIGQYLPTPEACRDPDFAPILAEDLDVLPRTLIITAEYDILTGQAEAYGEKLTACGVPVEISRYAGMIHGFLTLDAFLPGAALAAIDEIGRFVTAQSRAEKRPLTRSLL